jgi:hypothetical protein
MSVKNATVVIKAQKNKILKKRLVGNYIFH